MTEIFNRADLKPVRRKLRRESTIPERKLWARLRNRQVANLKFRRQYSVDRDVMDFYCPEVGLSIEADGYSHTFEEQWDQDLIRQQRLESTGITDLRFSNDEVANDIDSVIERIAAKAIALRSMDPHPDPLLGKERE